MSLHCPTCAAFARWAPIWEARRLAGDDARLFETERDALDLAERVAWSHAVLYFFHIGRAATPEEVERSRRFVCDDARMQRKAAA
jgi:hypothetical protein